MKLSYTVWTWHMDPFNKFKRHEDPAMFKLEFEKGVREISFLGYTGVENFNIMLDAYENDVEEFNAILDQYRLTFTAIYHYLGADFDSDMEKARRCIEFLKRTGGKIMNLQAPKRKPEGNFTTDVLETARRAEIMGKLAHEQGIRLCLHPHWGSTIETELEVSLFAQHTNPEYVHFCFDTAHSQLAGMDQIQTIERYKDRISYIHFKDVDPDVTLAPEKPMQRFVSLGQGTVDFKGIYKKLKEIGYDSVICVELDYPQICNFQSAQSSRSYLREALGI